MVAESMNPEKTQRVRLSAEHREPSPLGPATQTRQRLAARARGSRKRIVIHAGIHRTGSTAIQRMLSTGRADLEAQGILYPPDFVATDSHQRDRNHNGIAWALSRGEVSGKLILQWLAAAVPVPCKTVVLSAEDFCRIRDLGFVEELQGGYDVEAVFYLRRQDHWLNSWYNQHVRWPFDAKLSCTTPMEFLRYLGRFHWLQYFDLLERWAKVLGRDHVHARVLEKGQVEDTAKDFLSILGADAISETVRTNESISADKLELLRRLHFFQFRPAQRMKILNALEKIPSDPSTNVYDAGVRRLLVQRYAPQNQRVARDYLGRRVGPLFFDGEFPHDGAAPDGRPVYDEQLALKLIEALAS